MYKSLLKNQLNKHQQIAFRQSYLQSSNYLVFLTDLPVFPSNTYATRVPYIVQEILEAQKITHVGAFQLKDDVKPVEITVKEFQKLMKYSSKDYKRKNQKSQQKQQKNKKFNTGHYNMIKNFTIMDKNYKDHFLLPQNSDQIYSIGTKCKIEFVQVHKDGNIELHAIMRGVSRIKVEGQVKWEDIIHKFDDSKQSNKGFSNFKSQNLQPEKQQQEGQKQVDNIKQEKEITEQKQEQGNMKINQQLFAFARCVNIQDNIEDCQSSQFIQQLQILTTIYKNLRKENPINVHELKLDKTSNNVDFICGNLSGSSYLTKVQIIDLFQTLPINKRLEMCLELYQNYYNTSSDIYKKMTNKQTEYNKQDNEFYKNVLNFIQQKINRNQSLESLKLKVSNSLKTKNYPEYVRLYLQEQISNLEGITRENPEYDINVNMINLVTNIPFGIYSTDLFDVNKAKLLLDQNHLGLENVKQRILEFIAVSQLNNKISGKTILLVGPPGTGKTSIAYSIAKCINKKVACLNLSGQSDVAFLKGHRKTYIGSYHGKIIECLKQSQSMNAIIILDEIDKINAFHHSNIQDVLLDIIDFSKNDKFIDNYLDIPVDLSQVLFIATANSTKNILPSLLDRMEIINIQGYSREEKIEITQKYLIKSELNKTGLSERVNLDINSSVIDNIITGWSQQPGLRLLQQQIQKICYKIAKKLSEQVITNNQNTNELQKIKIEQQDLDKYLGLSKQTIIKQQQNIGTSYSIDQHGIVSIDVSFTNNIIKKDNDKNDIKLEKQKEEVDFQYLQITGATQLQKEQINVAYSYAIKFLNQKQCYNLNNKFLHVNISQSSSLNIGCAIATAFVSLALNKQQKQIGLIGELSLNGNLIQSQILNQQINYFQEFQILILPYRNKLEYEDMEMRLRLKHEIFFAQNFEEVFNVVFNSK